MIENTAYLDMIGGVSGDMLLGAMVDVGLTLDDLQIELNKIPDRGYQLSSKSVKRGGLKATFVDVDLESTSQSQILSKDDHNHIFYLKMITIIILSRK